MSPHNTRLQLGNGECFPGAIAKETKDLFVRVYVWVGAHLYMHICRRMSNYNPSSLVLPLKVLSACLAQIIFGSRSFQPSSRNSEGLGCCVCLCIFLKHGYQSTEFKILAVCMASHSKVKEAAVRIQKYSAD